MLERLTGLRGQLVIGGTNNQQPTLAPSTLSSSLTVSSGRKYRCFLTHNWGNRQADDTFDNHERVRKINIELRKRNILCWFDSDRMTGTVVEQMSSGIDDSDIIVGNLYISL